MSTRKKPQSRRPAGVTTVRPDGPVLRPIGALDALFRTSCRDCGQDHLHDLTLGHVTHDGGRDLRPSQRAAAVQLLGAGVPGDALYRVCCSCDYALVIEAGA